MEFTNKELVELCKSVWHEASIFDTGEDGLEVDEYERRRDKLIEKALNKAFRAKAQRSNQLTYFALDRTMMETATGNRSIFDDLDK